MFERCSGEFYRELLTRRCDATDRKSGRPLIIAATGWLEELNEYVEEMPEV